MLDTPAHKVCKHFPLFALAALPAALMPTSAYCKNCLAIWAWPSLSLTTSPSCQPNCVFIIPANRDLHVDDGVFHLKPISKPYGWPDVITVFLRSLTQCWDGKLIAVIVSGYDGDGAVALCGINEVGGITIAQKLSTATQPDMPESAIASGCIDFVLSPEEIAKEIIGIAQTQSSA